MRLKRALRIAAITVAVYLVSMSLCFGIESVVRGGGFWNTRITWTPAMILALVLGAFALGLLGSRGTAKKDSDVKRE